MSRPQRLVIVFVVDGLRPDRITPEDTPTLFRLRAEGVSFTASHAVVPTVTRVNAAALATGAQPGTSGLIGNQLYLPEIDPSRALDTGSHRNLLALDRATGGRLLLVPTLAERLHARGRRLVAVSSGSTGSALLLNPKAVDGVGAVVNGGFDPGKSVAYPAAVSDAILAKIGPAPPKPAGAARCDAAVAWAERALREFVLPELQPDVVLNWLTEPDHSQHHAGVGSPEARAALRHDDAEIARVLAGLEGLGLADRTDVLVASDHGFTANAGGVDVTGALIEAGLKASPDSTDVILASSGQAVALHVRDRDADRIARIARLVQSRDWGGVVFSAGRAPGDALGTAPGTFALEAIHAANPARGADLLITFPWTSTPGAHGVPGTDLACVSGGARLYASDHGSLSPWNVRNTLFAWGPGFRSRTIVPAAAGNVDVAPTILALLGLDGEDAAGVEGRVLAEALADGPDPEQVTTETRTHTVESGGYRAALQVSLVAGRRYVDKAWRIA
ncbi:MAG TPA: alkaline phosphatase family protein [Methylomirabilota bacterium]|nr:alkaline phosphatase family protein [Methylomirabilota bacterium]